MADRTEINQTIDKINDFKHHAGNMRRVAEKIKKLNKGQLKKIVDDEFVFIMAEYDVEI